MENNRHELQHIIKAIEPIGSSSLIKAAQSFLSRDETTSLSVKANEFLKVEEEKQLIKFIEAHKLYVNFTIDETDFIAAGAEQRVYRFDDRFVIKLKDSIFYLLWKDYFNNLLTHNYCFPATTYDLLGFQQKKESCLR